MGAILIFLLPCPTGYFSFTLLLTLVSVKVYGGIFCNRSCGEPHQVAICDNKQEMHTFPSSSNSFQVSFFNLKGLIEMKYIKQKVSRLLVAQ